MKVSKYFSYEEMINSATAELLAISNVANAEQQTNIVHTCFYLDQIREKFGAPIIVTSGFRCQKLNKKVGGVPNSFHLTGQAADIRPMITGELIEDTKNLARLYTICSELSPKPKELILYKTFVHVAFNSAHEDNSCDSQKDSDLPI